MAERVLRGSRLGATSYEVDRGTDLAPRRVETFTCPRGHVTELPLAEEAPTPAVWECRSCGAPARPAGEVPEEARRGRTGRSHWDMLCERRAIPELEALLAERLAVLRENAAPASRRRRKSA